PAASVRSEPGSNSHVENSIIGLRHVLNRRELHTCFLNAKPESPTSKTSVTSLDKRDRQSLFPKIGIATDPRKLRRPRFSFFSSSIVK
ncbi:hypothetical protein, partial [Rhizobium sp. SEMIA 4085]|uniref:hypothetical protein n=1 Tax=Rhizobium sp. SEMIA 4085 TaxID=2137761 RepID=UPI001AEE77A1